MPASYALVAAIVALLVLVHELGHFAVARLVRLPVARLSVGFGPALVAWRRNGTEYRLSWIPIGGYVLPGGRHGRGALEEPPVRRFLLSLGGPAANLVAAWLLLAVFNVRAGMPAWRAAALAPPVQIAAALKAAGLALASAFAGNGQVSGFLGVLVEGARFVGTQGTAALQFAVVMSVNLALLNALPLPPLDGGKALLCLLELAERRARALHVPANLVGLAILLALLGYATASDLGRLFS